MGTRAVVSDKRPKNKPFEREGPRLPLPKHTRAKKAVRVPEEFTRRKGIDVAETSIEIIEQRTDIVAEVLQELRLIKDRVGRLTQVPTIRDITKRVNIKFNAKHRVGEKKIFFSCRTVNKHLPKRHVVVRKARQTTNRQCTRDAVKRAMAEMFDG